jgi:hypothetical protein
MYRRYKRLSTGIFTPVKKPQSPGDIDIMGHLRLYGKFMECARLREVFRDRKVDPSFWDLGHEMAIGASRQRAAECESILKQAFDWWGKEAQNRGNSPSSSSASSSGDEKGTMEGSGTTQNAAARKKKALKRHKRKRTKDEQGTSSSSIDKDDAFERSDVFMFAEKIRSIDLLLREFCPLVREMCQANKLSFNDVVCFEMALELISLLGRFKESGCSSRVLKQIRTKTLDPRALLNIGCHILTKHRETGLTGIEAAEKELRENFPVAATAPPRLWKQFVIYHMYLGSRLDPEFGCPPCAETRHRPRPHCELP